MRKVFKKVSKKTDKNLTCNMVSGIIHVLSWYILYYVFEQYGNFLLLSKEMNFLEVGPKVEYFNEMAFFGIYFLLEVINCCFFRLKWKDYVMIQIILDGCLFLLLGEILRDVVFFVPSNTIENPQAVFRSYIHYVQQYIFACLFSNINIAIIYGIRKMVKHFRLQVHPNDSLKHPDKVRYFNLHNAGVLTVQMRIKWSYTDQGGKKIVGTYEPSVSETICISKEQTIDLNNTGIPDGAKVWLKVIVELGKNCTAKKKFTYDRKATTTAKYKMIGTPLVNKLEWTNEP